MLMERRVIRLGRSFLLLAVALSAAPAAASFVTFESGQVRPLALSPDGSQLFAVNTPDDRPGKEVTHPPLYNPEPASVKNGRPVLYDAVATSSNGEAACASCHVFADSRSSA